MIMLRFYRDQHNLLVKRLPALDGAQKHEDDTDYCSDERSEANEYCNECYERLEGE